MRRTASGVGAGKGCRRAVVRWRPPRVSTSEAGQAVWVRTSHGGWFQPDLFEQRLRVRLELRTGRRVVLDGLSKPVGGRQVLAHDLLQCHRALAARRLAPVSRLLQRLVVRLNRYAEKVMQSPVHLGGSVLGQGHRGPGIVEHVVVLANPFVDGWGYFRLTFENHVGSPHSPPRATSMCSGRYGGSGANVAGLGAHGVTASHGNTLGEI